jgi:4-hydroxyphenylacetate 3-monooxygenase
VGSEFASRHTQYERFYGGPPHTMNMYNFLHYPWNERQAIVDGIMRDMQN